MIGSSVAAGQRSLIFVYAWALVYESTCVFAEGILLQFNDPLKIFPHVPQSSPTLFFE